MKRLDIFTVLLTLILWVIPILPAQASELPGQAFVSGVIGHAQSYSLSCESRSAGDWAAFWGVDISEGEFLNALPRSSNPNEGFVGNPNDDWGYTPPYSYGVHAAPVAKLLRQNGLDAHAGTGISWEEIRAEVAAGRPVIVWVIGSIWSGTAKEYRPSDSETTIVAAFEHTMILVGYDDKQVHLVDAFTGITISHTIENFLTSWSVLGNMAVIGSGLLDSDEAETASNEPVDQNIYIIQPSDTLSKLAMRWNISWQEIAAANQISYPYTLLPGQEISMQVERNSVAESDGTVHKGEIRLVQPGEHLMQIARELEIDWEDLADFNDFESPYLLFPGDIIYLPGESLEAESAAKLNPADLPASFTASRHESLYALAYRYELNWAELATLNNLSFPFMLYPGQELQLQK